MSKFNQVSIGLKNCLGFFNEKNINNSACKVSELVPGDVIRCVIRLQGISQIRNKYGSRLRLQHSIPSSWQIPLLTATNSS